MRVLFLHVHKAAGTALVRTVQRALPENAVDLSWLAPAIRDGSDLYTSRVLLSAQFVGGHHIHQSMWATAGMNEPVVVVSVLRDPWERALSLCAHTQRIGDGTRLRPIYIEEYAKLDNPVCHFILRRFPDWDAQDGDLATRTIEVLNNFSYVGTEQQVEHIASMIGDALGIDLPHVARVNVAPSSTTPAKIDQGVKALFEQNHAADREVFESVRDGLAISGRPALLSSGTTNRKRFQVRTFIRALTTRAAWQAGDLLDVRVPKRSAKTMAWIYRNRP